MLRTLLARSSIRTAATTRTFTTGRALMTDGATGSGASRVGGQAAGDAFTKREKAAEEMWIKEEEKRKLRELHDKLKEQKDHIEKMQTDIETMMKESGGEQH